MRSFSMRIIEPAPQWSPYPAGHAPTATETMQSIPRDASLFPDVGPNCRCVAPWRDEWEVTKGIRFGEPIPMYPAVGFVGTFTRHDEPATTRELNLVLRELDDEDPITAREWLESDGVPEPLGTDDEDTHPAPPRASTPVVEGAPEDRERYPGKSLAW